MSCEDAYRLIARSADGNIGRDEIERLKVHLDRCASCRTEASAQAFVRQTLAARPADRPPRGFAARLAMRIEDERTSTWLSLLNWRTWSLRALPAVVALWVWAALGGHVLSRPKPVDVSQDLTRWQTGGGVGLLLTSPDVSDSSLLFSLLSGRVSPSDKENRR